MSDLSIKYVIRHSPLYYNGHNFEYPFDTFSKAKVFKTVAGAKSACMRLWKYGFKDIEIVEVETKSTENIIKYENKICG